MCESEYNGIVKGKCQVEGEHSQHYYTWEEEIKKGSGKGQKITYSTWW